MLRLVTKLWGEPLPAEPAFACLDPRPFLEYTDDIGLRTLATDCRWRNWNVGLNNNHNVNLARCGGDHKQAPGDYAVTTGPVLGAYFNKSVRGRRTMQGEITYLVGNRVSEWEKMCKSIQLTNLKFGARGALLDVGTGTYEELSIVIPKAKFNGVRGDNIDGYAAFRFSFATEFDTVTNGARIDVVNGLTCLACPELKLTRTGMFCKECRCPHWAISDLRTKWRMRDLKCPLDKW